MYFRQPERPVPQKEGKGELTFQCGFKISGVWKEGVLQGKATGRFPDGMQMSIMWKDGEFATGTVGRMHYEAQGDFPGRFPLQADPYECKYVYVEKSTVPGAGEGLFALRNLKCGALICYYNGTLLTHKVVDDRSWRYNNNTISLDEDWCIDVPLKHSSSKKYTATLGHKVNSSPEPNCEYCECFHPFYGAIKGVRALRDIRKDEELFTFYDYKGEARVPHWYKQRE